MTDPQWLELPISRTNFPCPKDVRAIEVQLPLEKYCELKKDREAVGKGKWRNSSLCIQLAGALGMYPLIKSYISEEILIYSVSAKFHQQQCSAQLCQTM